ncbi:mandelate racemase/muconate lactonizing enzyme family protein [Propylenella binzhouense]|nr:enolase C-terminal domain-like protein [Propylenella binzhouense]
MARITQIGLRRLKLPLIRPYRLSYRTFTEFEPFLVTVADDAGRTGFADAHVSPGSSRETREGGWAFCRARIEEILGEETGAAKTAVLARFEESKVAATALVAAIEVLEDNPQLEVPETAELPLLTPINGLTEAEIGPEIEDWLAKGFRTFKVKVGKDVAADLARVRTIQKAIAGRATFRLDANRAYDRSAGIAFASALDPEGIELFEQPCDSDDWEANAAVAAASAVPLMLDEPICTLADIARAGAIANVRFCKLKLKRFGGLDRLREGLDAVRAAGMEPVLGDGLGSEIHNWLEACVARSTIRNAGEFNGFIKPRERLLSPPLPFANGSIILPAGYRPRPDWTLIDRFTAERLDFTTTKARTATHGA